MDIEEYIEKIVDNGRIEDMETLSDLLEDTLEIIKDYDEECYKEMEMKLYKMAFGDSLNFEFAKKITSKMRPYGEKFSLEQSRDIQNKYGINTINDIDFYTVVNSAFNDYRDLFGDDIEMYAMYTKDFIEDEDAKPNKVFLYFTQIIGN